MAEDTDVNNEKASHKKVLVEVNNLVKYFPVRAGLLQRVKAYVKAVDDVSFPFTSMVGRRRSICACRIFSIWEFSSSAWR
jgi:ABC-type microcin C transport system duplicated ATPase subunit YejF